MLITLTLFIARIPPQSSIYCFRSRSKYSKTNVNDFSVCTMSCKVTAKSKSNIKIHFNLIYEVFLPILLCLRSLSRDTSRMAVQGAPSSCSNRISFRATKLSVNLDLPLKTVAYVPWKVRKFILFRINKECQKPLERI